MRENRTYGSEGGEGLHPFPTPIGYEHEAARFRDTVPLSSPADDKCHSSNQMCACPSAGEVREGGVCREWRLLTQLDGGQLCESPEDRHRDRTLCAHAYRVIRIWNNNIIDKLDGVLQALLSRTRNGPLTPALSPASGARGIAD